MTSMIIFLLTFQTISSIQSNPINLKYFNYTVKGIFEAEGCCSEINSLLIPNKITKCTTETFIYYNCKGVEKTGFLNKDMLIIEKSTIVECSSDLVNLISNKDLKIQRTDEYIYVFSDNDVHFKLLLSIRFLYNFINDVQDYIHLTHGILAHLFYQLVYVHKVFKILKNKIKNKNNKKEAVALKIVEGGGSGDLEKNFKVKSAIMRNKKKKFFCKCTKGDCTDCICSTNNEKCSVRCHNKKNPNCKNCSNQKNKYIIVD